MMHIPVSKKIIASILTIITVLGLLVFTPCTRAQAAQTATQASDYTYSYTSNPANKAVTVTLNIGKKYSLTNTANGAITINDSRGNAVETIPSFKENLEKQYPTLTVSDWKVLSASEAIMTITQQRSWLETSLFRGPSSAWSQCMTDAGVSGAIAGAIAGCLEASAIGCVPGAVTGAGISYVASVTGAIYACRSK